MGSFLATGVTHPKERTKWCKKWFNLKQQPEVSVGLSDPLLPTIRPLLPSTEFLK